MLSPNPDSLAGTPVAPISQPLWNHQYEVLSAALHSWMPQMHAFVPIGDAGCHAYSGATSVPCVRGIRGSC